MSKHKLFKISSVFVVVMLLSWSISLVADDDIKSATNNFSAMGLVSEISDDSLGISDAKGSDKSGKTTYDLNIDNLEKIQTNKNEALNLTDIKKGDKIIVQGLTNGSTFFIKRIISFTSVSTVIATTTATSTDDIVATSTATTTTTGTDEIVASSTSTSDTSTTITATTTATTTEILDTAATTSSATTTESIIPNIVEAVIVTINEIIENIVEAVTGDEASSILVVTPTENISPASVTSEIQVQDIPLQNLIENTEIVSEEIAE